MLEFIKKYKKTLAVLGVAVLGISQTEIPSGGMNILNSAGTAVIEFFDTGDAEFSGDVTANAFIGDGSGLTGVSGGTGHTIKEEGTGLTTRANLNFVGPTVTASDNAGTSSTDVTINAVAGPSSATDNTVPRFDSTTGKIIQASGVAIDDSNNVSGIAGLTASSLDLTTLLDVVEGGTGVGTLADAGVLIGNGTGDVQVTGPGTTGQVLTSNGTGVDPTFQSFPGGGDALTTNTLAQFAATTSAELAALLTNETGSGLAVFGTSPTLVTPNLGTPSALTLTNATGLPVAGGGTGASTLADAGVVIGNGTGAVQVTGPGTAGQVLTSNGTGVDPTFQDAAGGGGSGDLVGPASATDNAIVRYDGTTGKLVQNSVVTIADTTGNITTSGTVDGRDLSTDGTKLDGIESGATADQTNSEIETAYNAQVAAVTQAEAEAGTSTTIKRWTPERVAQAIAALGGSGGDPTYGSDAGAADDSVYVDATGDLGLGTTTPTENIHVYTTDNAPRIALQYYNTSAGDVTAYPGTSTYVTPGTNSWTNAYLVEADDATSAMALDIGGSPDVSQNLKTTNYSFAIPSGATISGVKVDVEGRATGSALEYGAYLVRGGTIATGVNRSTGGSWTTTDAVYTFGSSVDDWGGITPAEVNDSGFGFAYRVEFPSSGTCYIDYIRITIYYSDATGDYIWTSGPDISDGAYTVRANATDQLRIAYLSGDAEFNGTVTAPAFIGDGSGLTGIGGAGDVTGPASSTDNAIARFDSTTGKIIQNSAVTIADTSGNITTSGTVDGRDLSTDGTKLDGITAGASVSSVAISGTDGIQIDSGSPITTTGTIQLGVNPFTLYDLLWTGAVAPSGGISSTDTLLISDVSASGLMAEVPVSSFVLAPTGSDNYLFKKDGTTGQFEATGILVADTTNDVSGLGTLNGYAVPSGSGTLASIAGVQTITNKAIKDRILVESTSPFDVNVDDYDIMTITGSSGSPAAVGAPTGTPTDGQKLLIRWNQHASSAIVVNFNAVFVSGADWALGGAIPAVSTTLDAWDYYLFEWNNYESQWHLLACSQGN